MYNVLVHVHTRQTSFFNCHHKLLLFHCTINNYDTWYNFTVIFENCRPDLIIFVVYFWQRITQVNQKYLTLTRYEWNEMQKQVLCCHYFLLFSAILTAPHHEICNPFCLLCNLCLRKTAILLGKKLLLFRSIFTVRYSIFMQN